MMEFALKSPFASPFYQGGIFLGDLDPSFKKEGKGRFWDN
jgi:hypothetical protein